MKIRYSFILILLFGCRPKGPINTNDSKLNSLLLISDSSIIHNPYELSSRFKNIGVGKTIPINVSNDEFDSRTVLPIQSKKYLFIDEKDTISVSLLIFRTNKDALQEFIASIDKYGCCIPEEDLVKLKNFNNLGTFKNSPFTIIYTKNLMILHDSDNSKLNKLIDQSFIKEYYRITVGSGGPANWLIK